MVQTAQSAMLDYYLRDPMLVVTKNTLRLVSGVTGSSSLHRSFLFTNECRQ